MSLPDISRIASLPADNLRALGRRLQAIGVSLAAAAPIVAAASQVAPALRRPIQAFHLRRLRDPAGAAMRMFLFSDPVSLDEARAALGALLEPLLASGLLAHDDGGVVSPFVLGVVDDLYVFSDDLSRGSDAVMGFGQTTVELCRAAFPRRPVESALDLGCGSGTGALVLARRARRVIGTDINPRAILLARANAAINGITNAEFREGDLFEPVKGEAFDLVLSQPPFIPMPEGVRSATFLYGGRRGDELSLALLSGLTAHLAPRGRAVLMIEWPEHGSEPLERRLRAAIGESDANLLVLRMPAASLDSHAASYAAGLHPGLGRPFEEEAMLRREHFEKMGIRALLPTLTVVERSGGAPGWTDHLATEALGKIELGSERLDKLMAARALAGQRDRLLAATLRVPEGTVLMQEQAGPGAEVPSTLSARFAPTVLVPAIDLTPELLGLLTIIHEAPDLRAAVARLAEEYETSIEVVERQVLPAAQKGLAYGLLEVAGI
jgi:methylase of polypeptide subunit release factors